MATLTEAFARIAAENDIHYIDIGMNKSQSSDNARWRACVQWDGFGREAVNCAQINGATPEEALRLTLEDMRRQRTPLAVEADPLEIAA